MKDNSVLVLFLASSLAFMCVPFPTDTSPPPPGTVVTVETSDTWRVGLEAVQSRVTAAGQVDLQALLDQRSPQFVALPTAERRSAEGMKLIQGSSVKLDDAALQTLDAEGFVVARNRQFKNFFSAYEVLYAADLPLYVSADSILHAMHRSYDRMVMFLEQSVLRPDLQAILTQARDRLPALAVREEVRRDLDVWLAVTLSLLGEDATRGVVVPCVAGGSDAAVVSLVKAAVQAAGPGTFNLFGVSRKEDFSLFRPRGHYEGPKLEAWFRAIVWVGRVQLHLVDHEVPGKSRLRRDEVEAAIALRLLLEGPAMERWQRLDGVLRDLVGGQDTNTMTQVDGLLTALGTDLQGLPAKTDQEIADALVAAGFTQSRIATELMMGRGGAPRPQDVRFGLIGQRYLIDSHVLSRVTWDRTQAPRLMPSTLDVAYAVFRNDHALTLLRPELERYPYLSDLEQARALVEEHGSEFWERGAYNLWLGALRALSPTELHPGLPAEARTEAWGRRLLDTQRGSWAELRHDTIAYAAPSMTSGAVCEYPDAWVDPYPEFWARMVKLAEHLRAVARHLPEGSRSEQPFARLSEVSDMLRQMSERQLAGLPHDPQHLAFINRAVRTDLYPAGCVTEERPQGWYGDLFIWKQDALDDPRIVADIHTQPTDASGSPVGRVLHIGTGLPVLMVATVDTGGGPRAYAGVVYDYRERITEGFERLTDQMWRKEQDALGQASIRPPEGEIKGVGRVAALTSRAVMTGGIDQELVHEAVKRKLSQIRYCFHREWKSNSSLGGELTVKVTVAPDGSVSEAKVLTSSVGSSTVDACVLQRFQQMQLPDPARTQPAGFTYVLEFSGEM